MCFWNFFELHGSKKRFLFIKVDTPFSLFSRVDYNPSTKSPPLKQVVLSRRYPNTSPNQFSSDLDHRSLLQSRHHAHHFLVFGPGHRSLVPSSTAVRIRLMVYHPTKGFVRIRLVVYHPTKGFMNYPPSKSELNWLGYRRERP